jgi:Protein of unknown function (DUF1499)
MRWVRWIANAALIAAALVLIAGPLNRIGVDFRVSLGVFALGALVAGVAGLVSLIAALILKRKGHKSGRPMLAGVVGLGAFAVLAVTFAGARGVPPIHDITTDTVNPPAFVAVVPIRAADGAANPPEYEGERIAALQTAAYPKVRALVLDEPPASAFDKALIAVGAMGWELVDSQPAQGRIEATATTGWFGFKDDIVIRVSPQGTAARIDVRSKSRVGVGDMGANAKRIEAFLDKLRG